MATPATSASPQPRRTAALVGHARDEDDGHDRQHDPDQHQRRPACPRARSRPPTGMSAARTPVTGATMPIRPTASPWYSAVIPIAAEHAGDDAPDRRPPAVGTVSPRSQGQDEGERHADQLRDEHDAEQRGPPGQQAATEVARPQASAESRPRRIVALCAARGRSGAPGLDCRPRPAGEGRRSGRRRPAPARRIGDPRPCRRWSGRRARPPRRPPRRSAARSSGR